LFYVCFACYLGVVNSVLVAEFIGRFYRAGQMAA